VFRKGDGEDKDGEKRRGRNKEIERGRKNIWKDKKNFECMLFNIELFVHVLRF